MASFAPRPSIGDLLIGGLADALDPNRDSEHGPEPRPKPFESPRRPFDYMIGMTPCELAGIGGDAADGCPFAGEDFCNCDEED